MTDGHTQKSVAERNADRGAQLLIVGPPGSGKGTQATRIGQTFGIPDVSTGDIFRYHIKNETPLGVQVKTIVDAGDYVPNELTNQIVTERLMEADAANGFLLDGYPRTADQVTYLDALLAEKGQPLEAVIRLVADKDELVARLTKRSGEQGRADDSEEHIRHRQDVYIAETAPLVDIYRDRGILIEVDGLGSPDEVGDRIAKALAARGIGELDTASV